jgi:nucleoside-diphosphate-sugar epimerase
VRAFITGATGFIGAHLTRRLVEEGLEVAILRPPSSNPSRIVDLLPTVTDIRSDLADLEKHTDDLVAFRPDVLFHLAWTGVAGSVRNERVQLENLTTLATLVDVAERAGCATWIGVGSQAEYGPHSGRLDESHLPSPTTLYGATKLAAYHLSARLCAAVNIRHAWIRLFSAYGPADGPDWMIPSLIRSLLGGVKPSLTAGEQRWDYIYVSDVVEALRRVATATEAEGAFNLGSGVARPLRQIIELVRDSIDPDLPLGFGEVPYRPDQVMHLEADIGRLQAATGWHPKVRLEEGLRKTVRWYAGANDYASRTDSAGAEPKHADAAEAVGATAG